MLIYLKHKLFIEKYCYLVTGLSFNFILNGLLDAHTMLKYLYHNLFII